MKITFYLRNILSLEEGKKLILSIGFLTQDMKGLNITCFSIQIEMENVSHLLRAFSGKTQLRFAFSSATASR